MSRAAPVARDREKLRALALDLVHAARERDLTRLVSETEVDDAFVRVTIDRRKIAGRPATPGTAGGGQPRVSPRPATRDRWEEDVVVASGPRSQPRTVFAAPAAWLEQQEVRS